MFNSEAAIFNRAVFQYFETDGLKHEKRKENIDNLGSKGDMSLS
jgi:hypothetical protein